MTTHPVLSPLQLGELTLRNRVVKTATYESMTAGGQVTDRLIDHHATLARHGVALTTVAYGAVHPDGRTFDDQLLIDDKTVPGLRRLADAVHVEGGAVSLQLAHCGGFCKRPASDGRAPGGPSAGWNPYGIMHGLPRIRPLEEDELQGIVDSFASAAVRAQQAGFDAVEVHCGHGYLLSQFLSPIFNHRKDAWGGSLAGRAALSVEVVRAVRSAVGPGFVVLVKVNTSDGVASGLELAESIEATRLLVSAGATAVVPSGGLVQRSAFFLMRGDLPLKAMIAAESHPMQKWALRLFGPFLVRQVPYTPTFFFDAALAMKSAISAPVGLLGGVEGDHTIRRALSAGFDFVVMGRALLADPDLIDRLAAGEAAETRCTHCNACVGEVGAVGVRCVLE